MVSLEDFFCKNYCDLVFTQEYQVRNEPVSKVEEARVEKRLMRGDRMYEKTPNLSLVEKRGLSDDLFSIHTY